MWTGGYLELILGTRVTALFGGLLYSSGVFISSFKLTNYYYVLFFYGILPGIGCGITYGVDCSVAVRWFPKNPGLVSGIVLSGYGLGSLVFDPIITYIVNRDNLEIPFHVFTIFITTG